MNPGWEPQYVLMKASSASGYNWSITDSMRGFTSSQSNDLFANLANAETGMENWLKLNATGFSNAGSLGASTTFIYLAIRRPNKPPTTGTQVYNAIARTGTDAAATVTGVGFAPDFLIAKSRAAARSHLVQDRLRGVRAAIYIDLQIQESEVSTAVTSFGMDGVSIGTSSSINSTAFGEPYINHFFRRAAGFMDVVCYTGTGVARTVNHNLGAVPELMIYKCRSAGANWIVHAPVLGVNDVLQLNTTSSALDYALNNPTASTFYVSGSGSGLNDSSATYVAYLFATLAGISKVGSYTGNGSSQTINCGFATGARFILIKATSTTGDWYVWDSVRGIIAANDPHLSLNTIAAEVTTDDSVDPEASGFIVNQNTATNINVNGGQYIFFAIA